MSSKKATKIENEIEDPKAVYLDVFDKSKDLKSLADEIQNISNNKDFEILKSDKENYKNAESLYRERRELLKEIPNFWATIFTNLFLGLGSFENLPQYVSDFFVEESETDFTLYIDFKENNIIKNKQIVISAQTPSKPENMLEETKITSTPVELYEKSKENNKHPDMDDQFEPEELEEIQGFLRFLKEPTKEICSFIVGTIWMDPIASFNNDQSDDEDDEE
ncbi:hypothetical protein DICPUDRAFT_150917 [Dictyostelium purpureum]|uniref:Uncharacterized protein n=1 Tax=Dictyostelium purpureum TaxID=5786 RepID=F0ZHK2_DICPU|nr:uncharacterized protein DICPUDRAFT_150917 [Dictyostelium purpureum]EGC36585.1 hypothetical protein DICPUDRAFT_150917 [Dictyostelium purpureum]|eukprot:XP_003286889.1 hypothetical protein DICPUDRAFT_150917 [Dictyostelium purpureum]